MRQHWLHKISGVRIVIKTPILTDNPGEGRVEEVRVLVNARLTLRISLIREKLQIIVVLLFAKIIQSLEPVHVQVEIVPRQVQITTSRRRVALEFVMRSGKTLRLTKKTKRRHSAVRPTDGETHEISTGHSRVCTV